MLHFTPKADAGRKPLTAESNLNAMNEHTPLDPAGPRGLRQRAHAALARGATAEAISLLRQAIRDQGEHTPAAAPCWADLGVALAQAGQLAEAEQAMRQGLVFEAGHADAWCNLGGVARLRAEPAQAAEAYARALALGKHPKDTHFVLPKGHPLCFDFGMLMV